MPASSRRSWAPQRVITIIVGTSEASKKIKNNIRSGVEKAKRVISCRNVRLRI